MARRRLNTRFLIIAASTVSVVGAAGVLAYRFKRPINPVPYIEAGDAAFKKQDYEAAIKNYSVAETALPLDVSLHLKLGRSYFEMRSTADGFSNALAEFTKAEELDPKSKDAWIGLLDANELRLEAWESRPGGTRDREQLPAAINMVREAAQHLVTLEPDNIQARAAEPILIIRVRLLNLAMPMSDAERHLPLDKQRTPDQRVEQAISDLTTLMRDHPENEKFPYWIARAKIFQAQQALHGDHPNDAAPLFSEAATQFDQSIAAKPDKVALYINKAAILSMVKEGDPDAAAGIDYRKNIRESLDKAQSLADPKVPAEYQMAKQQWARNLSSSDPARAEIVYRDLLKRFPDELGIRLELAQMLRHDASRRSDALALLDAIPTVPGPALSGPKQRERWDLMVALSKLRRADIEIDQLANTAIGKSRDALANDITASIASAEKYFARTSDLLRIRGRFQLTMGQTRDAIQTLTAAADRMATDSGTIDYELLRLEALAYRAGSQTGKAIELLEKAMTDPIIANNAEIHITLAQMQLQNQDLVKAKPYIDWLVARYPKDPQIISLQISELGPDPDPVAAKSLLDQLPEKSISDTGAKYGIARQLKNYDEMIRLMSILLKDDPGNVANVSEQAQLLKRVGRIDEAHAVVDAAEKVRPGDASLAILRKVIDDASRKTIDEDAVTAIGEIKDPFVREMKLSQIYQLRQQPEEEMVHLQKAREVQPDNKQLLQTIFIRHMDAGRFPMAEAMIPHLAELDADDAHGTMLKSKLALAKKDVQNALQFGRQLTHDYPGFSGSWELYGEALRLSGQLDQACQQFVSALALQATNVEATRNLIQCSVQQGKLEDAKAYINDAMKRFPDDPVYKEMWVQYQILYGNPEIVVPSLTEALKQHPEDYRYYGITADALMASMRAQAAQGNGPSAVKYFDQAKELFKQALTRWPDDLKFANGLSQALAQSGDLPAAAEVLKTLSERPHWKDQIAPMILLARTYMGAGKFDQAEPFLHKAIEDDSKSVEATLLLAQCLVNERKYDDALAVMQPKVGDFSVRVKYTELLLDLGRGSQAEVEVADAIKADPDNVGYANLMLHVYDVQGKKDQGIKAATDLITNNRNDPYAYYWRAKLQASGPTANIDLAIKDLGFFLDGTPTDVDGHVLMAQLLDIKRDREGAIRELELSLKFAPQDRRVRMGLIQDYFSANPPRSIDGERLLNQTLALPAFAHDPEFETQAALVWAKKPDKDNQDKAVALMQDALKNAPNQSDFLDKYFNVLLLTKNYDLLLTESDKYTSDPKTSWLIFSDRGLAKTALSDLSGASAEFDIAMDRAGAEPGRGAAEAVAAAVSRQSGVDKALEKVLPRTQNSTLWKLVAINLYLAKNDMVNAMKVVDAAMPTIDTLTPADKYQLLRQASSLYITVDPPLVDKAMATYQKQLEMNPNDMGAMNDMACVYTDMTTPPNPKEALVWSQKAFDLSQRSGRMDTRIYDTQGWVLILLGRVDDGIDILHQAIDQAQFPEAHYHLAQGYLRKQLPEDAQRELDQASTLITEKLNQHEPVDVSLKDKIVTASKQVDKMIQEKMSGKAATATP